MRWSISSLLDIGADPTDSEEQRLQEQMLVTTTALIAFAVVFWAVTYYFLDERVAALIPGTHGVLSGLNI